MMVYAKYLALEQFCSVFLRRKSISAAETIDSVRFLLA